MKMVKETKTLREAGGGGRQGGGGGIRTRTSMYPLALKNFKNIFEL